MGSTICSLSYSNSTALTSRDSSVSFSLYPNSLYLYSISKRENGGNIRGVYHIYFLIAILGPT